MGARARGQVDHQYVAIGRALKALSEVRVRCVQGAREKGAALMGGGGQGGGSSNSWQSQQIAPEVAPLFGSTGNIVKNIQDTGVGGGGEGFLPFFGAQPQQIPGLTQGQQNVLQAYGARAFGQPFNAYDIAGTNYAHAAGGLNAQELSAPG